MLRRIDELRLVAETWLSRIVPEVDFWATRSVPKCLADYERSAPSRHPRSAGGVPKVDLWDTPGLGCGEIVEAKAFSALISCPHPNESHP